MGTNAAALPILDFARAPLGGEVCRVTIPPSPRPVYLLGSKGKGAPELWVRVGNSTRRLEVSDAVLYVSQKRVDEPRLAAACRAVAAVHPAGLEVLAVAARADLS